MRTEFSRALPLIVIFAMGLSAGTWSFVSPWALSYPHTSGWSSSVWSSVWVGAIVACVSGLSLVTVLARALHLALNQKAASK